jgi:geranylgeranyl diphosphate synthase, type II
MNLTTIETITRPHRDIIGHLRARQELVHRALGELFLDDADAPLVTAMRDALRDGKRLRPILCLEACEWVGGRVEHGLPAACAIEMIHKMTLTHDDLPAMDNADVRSGRPTVHKVHGEALAILAGDGLLVEAFGRIAAIREVPAERVLRAMRRLCHALGASGVAGGQAEDLQPTQGASPDEDWLYELHARKTGSLFEAAVVVGAELGGGSDAQITALAHYGRTLGIAFQILDDLTDVHSDEPAGGRPAATNYAHVFGPNDARRRARELLQTSVDALDRIPGGDTASLVGIAQYVLQRCGAAPLSVSQGAVPHAMPQRAAPQRA